MDILKLNMIVFCHEIERSSSRRSHPDEHHQHRHLIPNPGCAFAWPAACVLTVVSSRFHHIPDMTVRVNVELALPEKNRKESTYTLRVTQKQYANNFLTFCFID